MSKQKKILIVGLGLLGGSYAMGLSKKGWQVQAIDLDEYALAYAKEKGAKAVLAADAKGVKRI